jgi:anthranilate phosphoribosyltransferase
MRHTSVPRRELGIPTAMNVLGPLTNPAQPNAGLVGCADPRLAPVLAEVFAGRGASVLVVRGDDGLDELTTTGTSTVWVVGGGEVRVETLDPATLGVHVATRDDLRGGTREVNAAAFRAVLAGELGPVRDAVLLNSAGALVAADGIGAGMGAGPLADAFPAALKRAAAAIDTGAARDVLERWVALSTRLAASG